MASDRIQRRINRLLDQAEEAMDQLNWDAVRQYAKASGDTDALTYLDSADRVQPNPSSPETTPEAIPGRGREEEVYLAQDTLLDREVAFALIKTEGLDDVSRTRITREAQAVGRLGSDPHIVTVFDLGEHEGQPYMVAELMGGVPARNHFVSTTAIPVIG